jgi:hypothetical protein
MSPPIASTSSPKVPLDGSELAPVRNCIGEPKAALTGGAVDVAVAHREFEAIQPIISNMQVVAIDR